MENSDLFKVNGVMNPFKLSFYVNDFTHNCLKFLFDCAYTFSFW